jgi:hypothetical protein
MAMVTPLPVAMEQVLPHGAFVTGDVEPVRDFDAKGSAPVQKRTRPLACRCGRSRFTIRTRTRRVQRSQSRSCCWMSGSRCRRQLWTGCHFGRSSSTE